MNKPIVTHSHGTVAIDAAAILADLRELIHSARRRVATVANAEQTLLYWRLRKRILTENLTEGRAEYGKRILATLSQELVAEFGNGFSYSALTRMARFAELFADEKIVVSLIQHLGWTHFLALLPIKDPLAWEFYAEMCRRWNAGRYVVMPDEEKDGEPIVQKMARLTAELNGYHSSRFKFIEVASC